MSGPSTPDTSVFSFDSNVLNTDNDTGNTPAQNIESLTFYIRHNAAK